jgi:VanZ family protein
MRRIFSPQSPYKRKARFLAILWTLLIFIACFTPAKDIPKVEVPLIDKWTHLVLFGIFTFLWLCSRPELTLSWLIKLFLIAIGLGAFIEVMQGVLTFLGRSMEFMDGVADATGGLLGIAVFILLAYSVKPRG